ncbi:MAG: FAD-dependent oxidoreductase [Gemmatimonadaceae bacterium]
MWGKSIVLVGGGNSAGQAAILFADFASRVFIVIRNTSIDDTMSQYLVDQIKRKSNIHVKAESEVISMVGDAHLESIVVTHYTIGSTASYDVDALFVFIGAAADTAWLPPSITRDEHGYVCTGRDMRDLESDPSMPKWPAGARSIHPRDERAGHLRGR